MMNDTAAERLLARTVEELRAQLQNIRDENQTLRVGITQRDRWITELRSMVAAFMGQVSARAMRSAEKSGDTQ